MTAQSLLEAVFIAFVAVGLPSRLLGGPTRTTGTVLLLAGQAGLLLTTLPHSISRHPLAVALAVTVGVGALLGAARFLDRVPRYWLLIAMGAVLPFRIPLQVGDESFNLLVPLYGVLALGGLRLLLDDVRFAVEHSESVSPAASIASGTRMLDLAVALFVSYACFSVYWAIDVDAAYQRIALVFAPFAILYLLVRSWMGDLVWIRSAGAALVAVMSLGAVLGIYQHQTHTIWQNHKVEIANTYAPDFRTNSFFWDPNIFGRYLVIALMVVIAWTAVVQMHRIRIVYACAVGGLLTCGLWFTYSQSSFVALAAGCGMYVLLMIPRKLQLALILVSFAGVLMLPVAASSLDGNDQSSRTEIVRRGLVLSSYRPVEGIGIASFDEGVRQLARERGEAIPRLRASHTTPITVLAELGVIGSALYLLLITTAGTCAISESRRTRNAALNTANAVSYPAAAKWCSAAVLAVLTAHSLFYAGYFEDPALWIALALLSGTVGLRTTPTQQQ